MKLVSFLSRMEIINNKILSKPKTDPFGVDVVFIDRDGKKRPIDYVHILDENGKETIAIMEKKPG
jgi:hypothetical protein